MAKSNYTVGYRKPPRSNQFKQGQSGNPKGRPKGSKNLSTELAEELQEKIIVKEGGVTLKVSKQRAMLKALLAKALSGDARSAMTIFSMFLKLTPPEIGENDADEYTQADIEILQKYEADILANAAKSNKAKVEKK
jgi:hypothetical protein